MATLASDNEFTIRSQFSAFPSPYRVRFSTSPYMPALELACRSIAIEPFLGTVDALYRS